jgi:hypothetical protein
LEIAARERHLPDLVADCRTSPAMVRHTGRDRRQDRNPQESEQPEAVGIVLSRDFRDGDV